MAKYGDYSQFVDDVNRSPKRLVSHSSAGAEQALENLGVSVTSSSDFDDGVEFLDGTDIVGIWGESKNMLFHDRGAALV